jgi:hypothetical protein
MNDDQQQQQQQDIERFRTEAIVYGLECMEEGTTPVLRVLAVRMGYHFGYFGHSDKSRQVKKVAVLEEWHRLGIQEVDRRLQEEYSRMKIAEELRLAAIPSQEMPKTEDLPRIISTEGRKRMYGHLYQEYGPETAKRYAWVCANPSAKNAGHYYKNKTRRTTDAVV